MTFGSAVSNSCRRRVLLADTSKGRARAIARFSEYPMCLNAAPRSSEVRALGIKRSGGTAHPKGVCHGQTLLATLDECHDQFLCTITEHLFFTSSELATGMGGGVRLIITFFFFEKICLVQTSTYLLSPRRNFALLIPRQNLDIPKFLYFDGMSVYIKDVFTTMIRGSSLPKRPWRAKPILLVSWCSS